MLQNSIRDSERSEIPKDFFGKLREDPLRSRGKETGRAGEAHRETGGERQEGACPAGPAAGVSGTVPHRVHRKGGLSPAAGPAGGGYPGADRLQH